LVFGKKDDGKGEGGKTVWDDAPASAPWKKGLLGIVVGIVGRLICGKAPKSKEVEIAEASNSADAPAGAKDTDTDADTDMDKPAPTEAVKAADPKTDASE
jgi:hypothetical protein